MGFNTVIFDWRGQGLSTRMLADPQKGHVSNYDEYIGDFLEIVEHATEQFQQGAPIVFGHSMGAHVAMRAMSLKPGCIRAAVLSAPMVDIASNRLKRHIYRFLSTLIVAAGWGEDYVIGRGKVEKCRRDFSTNVLTHDFSEYVAEYEAVAARPELALGGPTWAWFQATFSSIQKLERAAKAGLIADPVLLLSAENDHIVSNRSQSRLARQGLQIRLVTIPGAFHNLFQEDSRIQAIIWTEIESFLNGLGFHVLTIESNREGIHA